MGIFPFILMCWFGNCQKKSKKSSFWPSSMGVYSTLIWPCSKSGRFPEVFTWNLPWLRFPVCSAWKSGLHVMHEVAWFLTYFLIAGLCFLFQCFLFVSEQSKYTSSFRKFWKKMVSEDTILWLSGNRFISITSHNRHCSSANHLLEMA